MIFQPHQISPDRSLRFELISNLADVTGKKRYERNPSFIIPIIRITPQVSIFVWCCLLLLLWRSNNHI